MMSDRQYYTLLAVVVVGFGLLISSGLSWVLTDHYTESSNIEIRGLGGKIDDSSIVIGGKIDDSSSAIGDKIDESSITLGRKIDDFSVVIGGKIDESSIALGRKIDDSSIAIGGKIDDSSSAIVGAIQDLGKTMGQSNQGQQELEIEPEDDGDHFIVSKDNTNKEVFPDLVETLLALDLIESVDSIGPMVLIAFSDSISQMELAKTLNLEGGAIGKGSYAVYDEETEEYGLIWNVLQSNVVPTEFKGTPFTITYAVK